MMMMSLVVLICNVVDGAPALCHEEIVARAQMNMASCYMGYQAVIAEWKEHSRFQGDQWRVARIKCESGDYQPKDAI
jgi:hypothetical protein